MPWRWALHLLWAVAVAVVEMAAQQALAAWVAAETAASQATALPVLQIRVVAVAVAEAAQLMQTAEGVLEGLGWSLSGMWLHNAKRE